MGATINPIKQKVRVLKHLGMTDKEKVETYLRDKTQGITNEAEFTRRLDIVCRQMIMDRFDGDMTFVKR